MCRMQSGGVAREGTGGMSPARHLNGSSWRRSNNNWFCHSFPKIPVNEADSGRSAEKRSHDAIWPTPGSHCFVGLALSYFHVVFLPFSRATHLM